MQNQYHAIGETAGKIYRALEERGECTTKELQKTLAVTDSALFHQALGWLARENKLCFNKTGRTVTLSLSEARV